MAVGRPYNCQSVGCGRDVTLTRLTKETFYAFDATGNKFLLECIPFNLRNIEPLSLKGKIVRISAVKKKEVKTRTRGIIPVFYVLDYVEVVDVANKAFPQGDEVAPSAIDDTHSKVSAQGELLRSMHERQPTQARRDGLKLEVLGIYARQEIKAEYPTSFSFEWIGVDAYIGDSPRAGADFEDTCGRLSATDQYKNTGGTYHLSQYPQKRIADHYTLGKVKSDTEVRSWSGRMGVTYTLLNRQVTEFPLDAQGRVSEEYRGSFMAIKQSILERMVYPNLAKVGAISN